MTYPKPFTMLAAVIFGAMALIHAYRIVTHFQMIFGSHVIPQWASWAGVIIPGILAVMLYKESKS